MCAIGSVFLSAVDIHNKITFKNLNNNAGGNGMVDYLEGWFKPSELRLMESCFEHDWIEYIPTNEEYYASKNFMHTTRGMEPDEVIKEIIANTIKYKTFSPGKGLTEQPTAIAS